ncbi:MAG: hypothetical protein J6Y20_07340 [Lachnospiraceae bacterium]|nr:hypothetical protein [Lachnospiraceae bacterium]
MYEANISLHSPVTEEEWDIITDVDFDKTDKVTFGTKHGKEVVFVKQKHGHWIPLDPDGKGYTSEFVCSACDRDTELVVYVMECDYAYCPHCGAKMDEDEGEQK